MHDMQQTPLVSQKKRFDGAMYNAAGSSYQMQWNIAEGYNVAYQEDDLGSVAVAESMNQVYSFRPSVAHHVNDAACFHMLHLPVVVNPVGTTVIHDLAFYMLQISAPAAGILC